MIFANTGFLIEAQVVSKIFSNWIQREQKMIFSQERKILKIASSLKKVWLHSSQLLIYYLANCASKGPLFQLYDNRLAMNYWSPLFASLVSVTFLSYNTLWVIHKGWRCWPAVISTVTVIQVCALHGWWSRNTRWCILRKLKVFQ